MEDQLWLVPPGSTHLESAYEENSRTATTIKAAQPFTVSLRTVRVAESFEGLLRSKGKKSKGNDIMVVSSASLGKQVAVERIHYYEKDLPKGTVVKNFMADTMYLCDDYSGNERFWMKIGVYEIDTTVHKREAWVGAFSTLAATAGGVFPVAAPYALAVGAGSGILSKIVDFFEENDPIIVYPVALCPSDRVDAPLLQTGRYVVFASPTDGSKYELAANGELVENGSPADSTYVVFAVEAVRAEAPEWVISQRVAMLLKHLHEGGPDKALTSIDALNDTLRGYSDFRDLKRYQALKKRDQSNLTQEEKDLMKRIEDQEELKPLLPA